MNFPKWNNLLSGFKVTQKVLQEETCQIEALGFGVLLEGWLTVVAVLDFGGYQAPVLLFDKFPPEGRGGRLKHLYGYMAGFLLKDEGGGQKNSTSRENLSVLSQRVWGA